MRNIPGLNAALAAVALGALWAGGASAQQVRLAGAACASPPPQRCPDADCPRAVMTHNGVVTEPKTGRPYFLDYPCDLKPGEDVTVVLSMHGGESFANWQRHYFPILDVKDKHRLVIVNATSRPAKPRWDETDDAYLQNITSQLVAELGRENVKAFWLAGHSNGGRNGRRIVCSDFFRTKADGFISLSGGRIGGAAPSAPGSGRPPQAGAAPAARPAAAPPPAPPGRSSAEADPACDFSHIFAVGEHEVVAVPEQSSLAARHGCGVRTRRGEIADTKAGYVYDAGHQNPASRSWGRLPRGGRAAVFVYPGCRDGRVVADVVRLDKGHTEGLEPNVTEELVRLMLSAPGGKVRRGG